MKYYLKQDKDNYFYFFFLKRKIIKNNNCNLFSYEIL
jgi:hypothetical protein